MPFWRSFYPKLYLFFIYIMITSHFIHLASGLVPSFMFTYLFSKTQLSFFIYLAPGQVVYLVRTNFSERLSFIQLAWGRVDINQQLITSFSFFHFYINLTQDWDCLSDPYLSHYLTRCLVTYHHHYCHHHIVILSGCKLLLF